jgi:predicted phage terminase large subunit-like protein
MKNRDYLLLFENEREFIDTELREKESAENSLSEFIRQAWHVLEPSTPYVTGWCIDAICEHYEAITKGQILRLLVNVPPGTMKSLITNVFWPAWEWGPKRLHHLKYLSASHKQDLAMRDNIKMRRLVMSEWYRQRYPHVVLCKDQNAKLKFENTAYGFKEAMAMGSLTGSRGDRVGIDDPLSVDDANSKTILESREITFTETIPTRLINPVSSVIAVIMQRLNERDTSGIILARKFGYVHLMLPMEFELHRRCSTSIGFVDPRKEEGELLFPERFPKEVVERDKLTLGSHATAGQMQQRPAPREGAIIKIAWLANRFVLLRDGNRNIITKHYKEIFQSWDTAFKEGEENDYSVCLTFGVDEQGYKLLHRYKAKIDFPKLEQMCIELANLFSPNQILIEDKASGQSLIQAVKRRTLKPVKAVKIDRDKIARLHAVSGYIEAGRLWLPIGEPWVDEYVENLTGFPSAAHDDEVDATTQFFLEIALRREMSLRQFDVSMTAR